MRYAAAILIGRLVRALARARKAGGGSAVPGLVVNRVAPGFLAHTLNGFSDGLVIVSGSSGKSTTTKMLVAILRAHGKKIFTNPSTANIAQGLSSALLEKARLFRAIDADIAVLEMDEAHGAALAPRLSPSVVVLTNVMVDQIDRFHDSRMVAGLLETIARRAIDAVVINGDDEFLNQLSAALDPSVRVRRYGVSADVAAASPRGLGHAAMAPDRLAPMQGIVVTAVGERTATVDIAGSRHPLSLPARGTHFAVDAAAAIAAAEQILGDDFDANVAASTIGTIPPVFGRGETLTVRGQTVEFVLVQNPASLQLNLDHLVPRTEQILIAIGSDVRDASYLWPVDTSGLNAVTLVSGSKAWEIALQLSYDGVPIGRVEPDLHHALDEFLSLPAPSVGTKTIIFSADSMRRTRDYLKLTSNSIDGQQQ